MSTFDILKAGMQSYLQSISDTNKQIQDAMTIAYEKLKTQ